MEPFLVAIAVALVGRSVLRQAKLAARIKVDWARLRNEAGGTGLGPAIARHIIERHGGSLWVESVEGVGSTFRFALPVAGHQS